MDTDPLSSWSCLWMTATAKLGVYVVTTSVSLISTKEIGQKQTIIVVPRGKPETDVHICTTSTTVDWGVSAISDSELADML